jgi:hypothetical protein
MNLNKHSISEEDIHQTTNNISKNNFTKRRKKCSSGKKAFLSRIVLSTLWSFVSSALALFQHQYAHMQKVAIAKAAMSKSPLVNRIYYLYYVRRRFSIKRAFLLFFFVTFFFTAYLYGLVQIDSHKVVINIMPGERPASRVDAKLVQDQVDVHIKFNDDGNSLNERPPSLPYELDPSVLKFFDTIEEYAAKIQEPLRKSEQEYLKRLKKIYETKSSDHAQATKVEAEENDNTRHELHEDHVAENKPVEEHQEKTAAKRKEKAADEHEEDYVQQTTTQSSVIEDLVPRADLVKFLRYEKVKFKFRKVRSVQNVIDDLQAKEELDTKYAPYLLL